MSRPAERDPLIPDSQGEAAIKYDHGDTGQLGSQQDETVPETALTGRTIGTASAYVLVLSRVIGSGIFAMPGTILQSVGSPGLALLLWVVGACIAWCGLSVDLEYGCMLPRSGGVKVYIEHTYPRPRYLAATIVAVHVVLLGFTASNCIVFAKYTLFAFELEPSDLMVKSLAVALMTAITIVHGCMYRTGIFIQNILGWLKIGLVVIMVCTSLFVVSIQRHSDDEAPVVMYTSGMWEDSDWTYNTLATALLKVFYSYAGLDNINNVLNEVKNPIRTLRWVPTLSLVTACALYLLINLAYLAVVPLHQLKQSRELIAALFFERCFGKGVGNKVLPFCIALSAAGNVMVATFSLARINQEVARKDMLPFSDLWASSRPFNAPLGGLILHYVPSVLVICLPPSQDVYAFVAEVEAYVGQYFALAVAIGLIILRRREPDLPRPFRAWLSAVYIRIALCIGLIAAPLLHSQHTKHESGFSSVAYALVGLSTVAIGLVYWAVRFYVLPRFLGYCIVEEADVLEDGTKISRLKHVPVTA